MKSESQLTSAYFDSDLDEEGQGKLRTWLLADPDHLDDFVLDSIVHANLIDLIGPDQIRANALVAAEIAPSVPTGKSSRHITGWLIALAATAASLCMATYYITSRSAIVATITGTRGAQWTSAADNKVVGALLRTGDEIDLDGGTLFLSFGHGGQVALHGPVKFRVGSDSAGQLFQGGLSAFVPEHAVGFSIKSGTLTFVDLGTEFHLETCADETCELQVFNGLVEVQTHEVLNNGVTESKLQISQGRGIRYDTVSKNLKPVAYNDAMRLPASLWSR